MLIGMLLEMLGVGLVVPLIALILQGDPLALHPSLSEHLTILVGMSKHKLIIVAMLGLVGTYLVKNAFLAFFKATRSAPKISSASTDDASGALINSF
jgi:hypothetical protein